MHAFVRFTRKRGRAAKLFRARMLPAYLCKRVWSSAKTKTLPILALGLPPYVARDKCSLRLLVPDRFADPSVMVL